MFDSKKVLKNRINHLMESLDDQHSTIRGLWEDILVLRGDNKKLQNMVETFTKTVQEKDREILSLKTYANTLEIRLQLTHPVVKERKSATFHFYFNYNCIK